jgi:hypothetical protein
MTADTQTLYAIDDAAAMRVTPPEDPADEYVGLFLWTEEHGQAGFVMTADQAVAIADALLTTSEPILFPPDDEAPKLTVVDGEGE